jgi:hypothetical protein
VRAVQAARSFSSSFPFIFGKATLPCRIPCAIDQVSLNLGYIINDNNFQILESWIEVIPWVCRHLQVSRVHVVRLMF